MFRSQGYGSDFENLDQMNQALEDLTSESSADAPVVTSISDSLLVMVNSSLTVSCSAVGNPEPSITWSFRTTDGRSLLRGRGHQLVVKAVSLFDAGRYECEARNSEGSQTAAVDVTVHGQSALT